MKRGIGGHQTPNEGATNEWLTPPEILQALGAFDLDPCSPLKRPWDTASTHYTVREDGLSAEWRGRVWLNPPYGPHVGEWLKRLAEHGDGIALLFARTETDAFFRAWQHADAMLFLRGRLHFHHVDGKRAAHNGGAPSVLIAFGKTNVARLRNSGLKGAFVERAEVFV
jgi:hypothetical protein